MARTKKAKNDANEDMLDKLPIHIRMSDGGRYIKVEELVRTRTFNKQLNQLSQDIDNRKFSKH